MYKYRDLSTLKATVAAGLENVENSHPLAGTCPDAALEASSHVYAGITVGGMAIWEDQAGYAGAAFLAPDGPRWKPLDPECSYPTPNGPVGGELPEEIRWSTNEIDAVVASIPRSREFLDHAADCADDATLLSAVEAEDLNILFDSSLYEISVGVLSRNFEDRDSQLCLYAISLPTGAVHRIPHPEVLATPATPTPTPSWSWELARAYVACDQGLTRLETLAGSAAEVFRIYDQERELCELHDEPIRSSMDGTYLWLYASPDGGTLYGVDDEGTGYEIPAEDRDEIPEEVLVELGELDP